MRSDVSFTAESTVVRMTGSSVVIAVCAYSAIAVLLTFPLVLHLSSVVPHDVGDPMLSTAILWWNAHVLPLTERWWNGFAFYPAPGFMALSDSRLGESLLATPLQWLGCSPVTSYNVTLLATYPLCAIAAHWLGFVLAKRHDAAAICGLAYAFCPYRVAHLQHLELLGAFGMPAALAMLHRHLETRERRWLVGYALALVLQGLCASYYLLFFAVLVGLWILWFVHWRDRRALLGIAAASAAAVAALSPIAIGYSRIHSFYGFVRSGDEIVRLSADLTAFFTASPLLTVWGWTARWARSEGELFPGATIAALAATGAILAWRRRPDGDDRDRVRKWMLGFGCAFAALAICGWMLSPWRINLAGLKMSSAAPYKPLSLATAAVVVWFGTSSRMRAAYARRSAFAFYLLATVAMLVCSLGPKPMLGSHQILYEPPYAWLLRLPLFESVRVPARFAMPGMLALSVSGALALGRLHLLERARRRVAVALMAGIIADGWVTHLPLPAVPDFWPRSRADGFAAVLELPLGDVFADVAAMYRGIDHRRPVMNGDSGFIPTHYAPLVIALNERDPAIFDGFPAGAPVLIVIDRLADSDRRWETFLAGNTRMKRLAPDNRREYFAAEPPSTPASPCSGDPLPIVAAADDRGPVNLGVLTDRNPRTFWTTSRAQQSGDTLRLDLGQSAQPCALFLAVGPFRDSYPRHLTVDTSGDGINWSTVATLRTAGLTMRAALEDPKDVVIPVALLPSTGRFVRMRADQSQSKMPWVVTDVLVKNARARD